MESSVSESAHNAKEKSKEEEALKECQKLLDTKVNTEDFICVVEHQTAIWDASSETSSNKQVKLNAWNEIICTFLPDFEQRSLAQRNNLMTLLQKKCKSVRSCYTRELLRLKSVKSGSAATRKKQYTYFEQLRFLDIAVKKTTSNVDEEHIANEDETSISYDSGPTCSTSQNKSKERSNNDHELIEVLKKKIVSEEQNHTLDETDEDKLFLLSMLSEIRKVPAEYKLKLQADIIALVAAAQIPQQQQWQQVGYTVPSNPMPPPSMLQYPLQPLLLQIKCKQQRLMERNLVQQQTIPQSGLVNQQPQIHYFQTQFQQCQDVNMPLQSPSSADTSVTSNEDSDTQMSEHLLFNM